jgi:endonuclease/exonuclease/phosphatase family metal-dependent hydrolase
MGIGRRPTIPPGKDDEYLKGYRDFIGDARVVGLCEYSAEFSTNQTLRTVDALFDGYDVKLEGTDMFPQSNSIFAKECQLIETKERQYPKKKRAKYYKFARLRMDGREVCVIETHLDFDTGPDDPLREARADQMRTLIADMEKEKYVIICGDFNISSRPEDTPDHAVEYDVFANAGYTLANRGQLITWPSWNDPKRECALDNIIVKGFKMSDVEVKVTIS